MLQFDSHAVPSEAMVRASHTLCGIHRAGGFPLIATTARALEQALLALQQHGPPMPATAQPVLARAITGLADFTARVRARFGFLSAHEREGEDIERELDALRQDASVDADDVAPVALDECRRRRRARGPRSGRRRRRRMTTSRSLAPARREHGFDDARVTNAAADASDARIRPPVHGVVRRR